MTFTLISAGMGYSDCVKVLLKFGAGIEILMGQMKMSALHLAAQEGNVECVEPLLEAGASVRAENVRGQSPLHLAALAQSPETVELLLSRGKGRVHRGNENSTLGVSIFFSEYVNCV